MSAVAAHTRLGASTDAVWSYVTDPSNFAAYVEGYEHGHAVTAARTGLGARYEWVGRAGPLRIAAREEVVGWRDGRRVDYRGSAAGVSFGSAMEIEPDGDCGSLLRIEIDFRLPARFGGRVTDALIARPLMRSHVERSLRRLERTFG